MTSSSTRSFAIAVDSEQYSAQVTSLDHCFLIWVGQKRAVDTMAFGFCSDLTADRSPAMLLVGPRDAKAQMLERLAGLLSKKLLSKQVFVSTDLATDDAEKWQRLEQAICKDIDENRSFYY